MTRITWTLVASLFTLCAGCGLPLPDDGSGPWKFYSAVAVEHWIENSAGVKAETPNYFTASQAAVVTWRIGKDAPLPHMWRHDANCLVIEGSWKDTDHIPPSHGKMTVIAAPGGPKLLSADRNGYWVRLSDPALKEGVAVTVTGAGDALPAFELSATVDAEMTLTSPAIAVANREQLHISRATPFTVTWEPRAGQVLLQLMQYPDIFHGVWCTWPAMAGTGTVPVEALGTLLGPDAVDFSGLYFGSVVGELQTNEKEELQGQFWNGRGGHVIVD
jgi:hypothetical protein